MSDAFKPGSPTRRSARVHHEVMVGVTSEHGTFSGWGTNLSAGGVFVNSHHAPPIGTRVHVLLQLPSTKPPFPVPASHASFGSTTPSPHALRLLQSA